MSATVIELLQAKASQLESLEIRRDNLATAIEVPLCDLAELKVREMNGSDGYLAKTCGKTLLGKSETVTCIQVMT